MIVLDAGVLIAYLGDADVHHLSAINVLSSDDELGVHVLNLAEVLVQPGRDGHAGEASRRLSNVGVVEIARVPSEAALLATLRVETRLRLPGCCALLAAEVTGSALATFDARLARVARERGIEVLP